MTEIIKMTIKITSFQLKLWSNVSHPVKPQNQKIRFYERWQTILEIRKSYLMFIATIKENNDLKQWYHPREIFLPGSFIRDRGKWADTPVAFKQLLSQHFVLIFKGKPWKWKSSSSSCSPFVWASSQSSQVYFPWHASARGTCQINIHSLLSDL